MSEIDDAISSATGVLFKSQSSSSIGGGCINQASKIHSMDGRTFFLKINQASFLPFFEAEAEALKEIRSTQTIMVPDVITHGVAKDQAFLVLEYIEEGRSSSMSQSALGKLLAKMHKIEQPFFGWERDNCIGATPQPNPKTNSWSEFYRDHRLAFQFKLAQSKGRAFEGVQKLLESIESFFSDYSPHPSLLHGDLWGGNASCDSSGVPFLYDPASYYGDREADLAFTYMFGGFSSSFYNLYHELNHFNLFGGGYASSAQSSIDQLLSQL
jgi:protein-ribulosamine 3-kinase